MYIYIIIYNIGCTNAYWVCVSVQVYTYVYVYVYNINLLCIEINIFVKKHVFSNFILVWFSIFCN